MELITILNRCHRFRGFVYQHAYFSADKKSIEVADSDGVDLAERPVFETRGDDMFDRVEELVPGCAKFLRRPFP